MATLERIAASWAEVAGHLLWQTSLLILVAWGIERLMLRARLAPLRPVLWTVVALRFLLPPTFESPVGATALLGPGEAMRPQAGEVVGGIGDASLLGLLVVWAAGVLVCGAFAVLRHRHGRRAIERDTRPASTALVAAANQAAERMACRTRVDVRFAPEGAGPAVLGLRRPLVLVPATLRGADLDAALYHELMHVRRRDLWKQAALTALHVVFWFQPLCFLLRRRAQMAREIACDLDVARRLRGASSAYRSALLRMAAARHLSPRPLRGALGLLHAPSTLIVRLRLLERPPAPGRLAHRTSSLGFAGFLLACIVPLGCGTQPPGSLAPTWYDDLPAAEAHLQMLMEAPPGRGCHERQLVFQRVLALRAGR